MILLARWMASRRMMAGARQAGARIGHRKVLQLQRLAHQVGHGLHGDAAGDFAGVVAAHAVGEHDEAQVAVVGDRVLVVLADPARVAQADAEQFAFEAHQAGLSLVRAFRNSPHRT